MAYGIEDAATAQREYEPFSYLNSDGEKLLITMDDDESPMRDGVRHIQAWKLRI